MDEMKLLEAVGAIDDVVLKKALSYRPSTGSVGVVAFSSPKEKEETQNKKPKSKRNTWIKWVSIAACFCLMFVGAFALIANFVSGPSADGFVIEDKVLISYTGNDKNVVIPDNVVKIANYAFRDGGNAEAIETITLGKKLSVVETYALEGCVNLKAVNLSEKNDTLKTQNNAVLSSDGKQLIYLNATENLTSYTVPNGVERIGSYAFVNSNLTELIFPDSVTTLDSLAVIFNDTLEKVSLGGVVEISERAFYNNIALKTVELPKATVIGEAAFSGCSALESVNLPNVIDIKKDAFTNCKNLNYVNAPKVVTIGENAFYDCDSITSLSFPTVTSIGNAAFQDCGNLTTLNIQNVTSLGDWFIAETNVSVLILPKISEGLGEYTFAGRGSVELWGYNGSYLESFANEYNYKFVEIKELDLPAGFSPVNDYMYVCVNSVNVRSAPEKGDNVVGYLVLDQEVKRVATDGTWSMFLYSDGKYRFVSNSCLSKTNSLVKPIEPTDKTYGDFNYVDQGNYITITKYTGTGKNILVPVEIDGKPVEEIKANAFASIATSVESIQANSIKRISGMDTFLAHCYKLQSLQMNALEELPANAVSECVSLKNIELTNLKKIGSNVFVCGAFTELYLTKVESIAEDAFDKSGIKTLHGVAGSYAQTWATTHQYGFVDVSNDYTPTYPETPVEIEKLTYTPIYNGGSLTNGDQFGYQGVSIAHDSTGKLYLYVEAWNKYIPTTFAHFEDYSKPYPNTDYQTATTYGNYAWLIASNGSGRQTKSLSVLKTDVNGTSSYGHIDLGASYYIEGLYCSFSSEQHGKLIINYSEQYHRCMVYETENGGATWNRVTEDIISAGNRHESIIAAGFVSDNIGYISYEYFGELQPNVRTYITTDGGKTWKSWNVTLPSNIIQDGYGEVIELKYDNGKLILTVVVRGGSFTEDICCQYVSTDSGSTWTLQND